MQVLEQFIMSKTGRPETCEDAFLANDHFICVADGATAKTTTKYDGKTTGRMAAELVTEAVKEFPPFFDIDQAAEYMTEKFRAFYRRHGMEQLIAERPYERFTASVVIASRYRRQIWMIGDCQVMVDGRLYRNDKLIDEITTNARVLFDELELLKGATREDLMKRDVGYEFIEPLLTYQSLYENAHEESPYCHGVVNGLPIPMTVRKVVEIPEGTQEIVLATDGYPILKRTLQESEAVLADLFRTDPLCLGKYKSVKGLREGNVSYDDRCYVRVNSLGVRL